jgi:uncharacterized membrane protein YbaN (DUF454 family)
MFVLLCFCSSGIVHLFLSNLTTTACLLVGLLITNRTIKRAEKRLFFDRQLAYLFILLSVRLKYGYLVAHPVGTISPRI